MLKGAQVDLTRYQGLAAQNAVPHQTLDTQVALVARTRARSKPTAQRSNPPR